MTRRAAVLAGLVLVLAATVFPAAAERREGVRSPARERAENRRPDLREELGDDWSEVLVVTHRDADDLADKHHGQARGQGKWKALTPPPRGDKFNWFAKLERDPDVHELQPNYAARHPGCRQMSIDIFETGEILDLLGQLPIQRINGDVGLTAPGTIVAVVDSGVALVEELEGRLLPPIDVLASGNGAAIRRGRGNANGQHLAADDPEAWDGNGHGTAMASLIVAVADDVMILPVRVVGKDCTGNVYDLAMGIRLAAEAGAQVISVSIGTERDSPVLREAVDHATELGALVVGAAGNSGGLVEYPARYENAVAVTAVDDADWPASFSALGAAIDLAAPGVAITARVPATGGPGFDYAELSGTSPATALTAAAAAVVVSRTPGESVEVRRNVLLRSVRPVREVSPELEGEIGEGVLDLLPLR
jgi:subtilisin family serine protease